MVTLPLLRGFTDKAVFAYRAGRPITVGTFLRDVASVAGSLPERQFVLNLCADRYLFTVGFAAALVRKQVSLLPPNLTPDTLTRLAQQYPGAYCLADDGAGAPMMETLVFPELRAGGEVAAQLPRIPGIQTAVIVFTSGSTGQPLPYPKSWGRLVAAAGKERGRRRPPGISADPSFSGAPHPGPADLCGAGHAALRGGQAALRGFVSEGGCSRRN